MKNVDLSIIVPFYNEKDNLPKLHQELLSTLAQTKLNCEVIYVNDGSLDQSENVLAGIVNKANEKILTRLVSLRRNFGQTAATSAGIDQAKGEFICLIDADLQNDPNDILLMLQKINDGFDIVIGWRKERRDNLLRSFLSKSANYLIQKIFNIPFHDLGCSLKLIRKDALSGLRLYGESHRILPLILYWRGAKTLEIVVNHRNRLAGKSKYGYSRIIKLIIDVITVKFLNSYGTKPAYVFGTIGILSNILGVILLAVVGYDKFVQGVYVHRNPLFLIASFLMLLGIQFQTRNKTIYEIKKVNNF